MNPSLFFRSYKKYLCSYIAYYYYNVDSIGIQTFLEKIFALFGESLDIDDAQELSYLGYRIAR